MLAILVLANLPTEIHAAEADAIDFNREIRPILSNNCFKCHGPDEGLREAGLRLDTFEGATAEADSGAEAIIPGNATASEVTSRIHATDDEVIMPPPRSNKHLTPAEKTLIDRWIAAGAKYEPHWAFVPPKKMAPPGAQANPIDAFITAKLAAENMTLSPPADKYSLCRRVSLDLVGIPPTPQQADAFVNDPSPQAYENLVDRLLASPHYGERWARRWLDLARYADTNGFEKDRARSMWPYRDWVINAINTDMPVDQFTVKQLAGDMLPGATQDDRIATGFHRNTMLNEEGGIDPQEYRFMALVDRVGTTGTTWLGLTTGCAQCHTHKYDPLVHREFYQLMAFFNQADEPPFSEVVQDDIAKRRAELETLIARLTEQLPDRFVPPAPSDYVVLKPVEFVAEQGTTLVRQSDDSLLATGLSPERDNYTVSFLLPAGTANAVRLEAMTDPALPSQGPGRVAIGNFVVSKFVVTISPIDESEPPRQVTFTRAEADFSQQNYSVMSLLAESPINGWAIHDATNPKWNTNRTATFYAAEPFGYASGTRVTLRIEQQFGNQHTLGKFRVSVNRPLATQTTPSTGRKAFAASFEKWFAAEHPLSHDWTVLSPTQLKSNLATLDTLADQSVLASGDQTKRDEYDITYRTQGKPIRALRLEVLTDPSLPNNGPGRIAYEGPIGDFYLSMMQLSVDTGPVAFGPTTHSFAAGGNVAAGAVDDNTETGWSVEGGQGKSHRAVFTLPTPLIAGQFTLRMIFEKYYAAAIGRFRLSATADEEPYTLVNRPAEIEALLHRQRSTLSPEDVATLEQYYASIVDELKPARDEIAALRAQLPAYPTSLTLVERRADRQRETHRHHRGEYLQPKEVVSAGVPAFLPALPADVKHDRLAFAQWLVDGKNPLTARVAINRHWQAFFGYGLVRTTEDFGTQGDLPSHPELLDWLAQEYVDCGWSTKHMHRLIVLSDTYRQQSTVTPELLERDPQNKLLSRAARFRLDAELVRDVALHAAGLLSEKIGGPSVYPPQSASVSEASIVNYGWPVSGGEDRYRRGLYTFVKRTAPYAMFNLFDTPSGETCISRRERSNSSLQALTLLNDEVFIETARALALQAVDLSPPDATIHIYRRLLTVPPSPETLARIIAFYDVQLQRLASSELDSKQIAPNASPDKQQTAAAWTLVARALQNLDAVVTKE